MRALRKVTVQGVEYKDITHAAQALDIDPATLQKDFFRKGDDRWILNDSDHFADDPDHLKDPPTETPVARSKEKPVRIPGGPPVGGPGISDYELARRRRIYFTKVEPFQTDEEKPAK